MSGSSSSSAPQMPAFLQLRSKFVDLEWQQRKRLAEGQQPANPVSQWARVTGDDVLMRNRYLNVDPYLNNRIRLRVPEGQSDYINASPITLKRTKDGSTRKYIATQGPKEAHFSHIWRMIYNEISSPAVIVMLTQTHEAGREKCFQYFPLDLSNPTLKLNEHDEFQDDFKGSVILLEMSEDEACRSTVRKLSLSTNVAEPDHEDAWSAPMRSKKKTTKADAGSDREAAPSAPKPSTKTTAKAKAEADHEEAASAQTERAEIKTSEKYGEEKVVWHLLFSGWPDFLVPEGEDKLALLELVRLSAAKNNHNNQNPRVIHCSAGVGRSGTFIALDHLLSELEDGMLDTVPDTEDRIADTVDTLRKQRMMMVQGEAQFHFLYEVLREQWLERHSSTSCTKS